MSVINLVKDGKNRGRLEVKNLSEQRAELVIYGEIISDSWGETYGDEITPSEVKELLDFAGKRDLDIFINSPGGNIFAGFAIYNLLERYEGKKRVFVEGLAASISSVIAMAGDEIYIPSNAYFMIHKAWGQCSGNADDLRKRAEIYDRYDETMASIYTKKLRDGVDILEIMKQETWINGLEAPKYFDVITSDAVDVAACLGGDFINNENVPQELKGEKFGTSEIELTKAKLELKLKLI